MKGEKNLECFVSLVFCFRYRVLGIEKTSLGRVIWPNIALLFDTSVTRGIQIAHSNSNDFWFKIFLLSRNYPHDCTLNYRLPGSRNYLCSHHIHRKQMTCRHHLYHQSTTEHRASCSIRCSGVVNNQHETCCFCC